MPYSLDESASFPSLVILIKNLALTCPGSSSHNNRQKILRRTRHANYSAWDLVQGGKTQEDWQVSCLVGRNPCDQAASRDWNQKEVLE
jgi:hypothetical protein